MSGTNPVATYVAPDNTSQTGATYKGNIDGAFNVGVRLTDAFAPHAQSSPNMTIALDAGYLFTGETLTEIATQNTGTITAPITNDRIDRVVIDSVSGTVSVITGVENASPVAPAITAGKIPVARVLLHTSTTSIGNSLITDERALWQTTVTEPGTATASGATLTLTAGVNSQINVAMQHNVTFTIANGSFDGQPLRLRLTQDGTGSRTVAFDSSVVFGTDIASFTATTTINKADYVDLVWSSAASKWHFLNRIRGF